MRHLETFLVLTTAAALSLTGCGQMGGVSTSSAGSRGGMAVVDLDKVASETGRDRQLAETIKMKENSLNQELEKIRVSVSDQLETKKKTYGTEMSDTEKKEYSDIERLTVTKLSQIQNQARAQYEQFKQSQVAQFRAELKPIAQEIAAKRGLSLVIPKNEGLLLSVDPGVDITDDVIKLMREKHPTPVSAPVAPPAAVETADSDSPPAKASNAARSSSSAKPAGRNRTAKSEKADDEQSTR